MLSIYLCNFARGSSKKSNNSISLSPSDAGIKQQQQRHTQRLEVRSASSPYVSPRSGLHSSLFASARAKHEREKMLFYAATTGFYLFITSLMKREPWSVFNNFFFSNYFWILGPLHVACVLLVPSLAAQREPLPVGAWRPSLLAQRLSAGLSFWAAPGILPDGPPLKRFGSPLLILIFTYFSLVLRFVLNNLLIECASLLTSLFSVMAYILVPVKGTSNL